MPNEASLDHLTWVDVVGFQHETIHTAILKQLLSDPGEVQDLTLHWLVGDRDASQLLDSSVHAAPEDRPLGKQTRVADLVVRNASSEPVIVVETKVHSSWSSDQLDGQITDEMSNTHGVLFVLGAQGLVLRREMLPDAWEHRSAADWLDFLKPLKECHRPWFLEYRTALEERVEHYCRLQRAAMNGTLQSEPGDDNDRDWAFFAAVLDTLESAEPHASENVLRHEHWRNKTLTSGPVLDWGLNDDANKMIFGGPQVFLNLMGGSSRQLCVKIGAWGADNRGEVRRVRDRALEVITEAIAQKSLPEADKYGMRPGPNSESCMLASYQLSGSVTDAADRVRRVATGLLSLRDAGTFDQ